jgi:hypothetical protein
MSVRDLTNIAHIHRPSAIIMMFLVKAKAHITPSNEKLASSISRYINVPNPHASSPVVFLLFFSSSCSRVLTDDIIRNVISHIIHAVRNVATSCTGNHDIFVTHRNVSNVITTSNDSNFHRFTRRFSIVRTQ